MSAGANVAPRPFILQIFGFPAAGKLTVARELAQLAVRRGEDVLVLDNHHINNVLFPIARVGDGVKLSPRLVEHVLAVRDRVLAVVEELAPPQRSFVFTNVLIEDPDDIDRRALDEMAALAGRTGGLFLAVRLTCDLEVLAARTGAADRCERMKWLDPDGVRRRSQARVGTGLPATGCGVNPNTVYLPVTARRGQLGDCLIIDPLGTPGAGILTIDVAAELRVRDGSDTLTISTSACAARK